LSLAAGARIDCRAIYPAEAASIFVWKPVLACLQMTVLNLQNNLEIMSKMTLAKLKLLR